MMAADVMMPTHVLLTKDRSGGFVDAQRAPCIALAWAGYCLQMPAPTPCAPARRRYVMRKSDWWNHTGNRTSSHHAMLVGLAVE